MKAKEKKYPQKKDKIKLYRVDVDVPASMFPEEEKPQSGLLNAIGELHSQISITQENVRALFGLLCQPIPEPKGESNPTNPADRLIHMRQILLGTNDTLEKILEEIKR